MGCVKKAVPWIIDPIGTAVQKVTGFDYTPGGMVNKVLNPPKPPAKKPPPTAAPKGAPASYTITLPAPPAPAKKPVPADPYAKVEKDTSGATSAADTTRGLVVTGRKKMPSGSLLS